MQAMLEASHFGAPLVPDLPSEPTVPATDFEPGPPKISRAQAAHMGFTGNQCASCGSMQMVRNGTCEKCNDCGATTGCS
ncbi:class II ribonucleotide reductase [Microcystis phage Mae-JY30]